MNKNITLEINLSYSALPIISLENVHSAGTQNASLDSI